MWDYKLLVYCVNFVWYDFMFCLYWYVDWGVVIVWCWCDWNWNFCICLWLVCWMWLILRWIDFLYRRCVYCFVWSCVCVLGCVVCLMFCCGGMSWILCNVVVDCGMNVGCVWIFGCVLDSLLVWLCSCVFLILLWICFCDSFVSGLMFFIVSGLWLLVFWFWDSWFCWCGGVCIVWFVVIVFSFLDVRILCLVIFFVCGIGWVVCLVCGGCVFLFFWVCVGIGFGFFFLFRLCCRCVVVVCFLNCCVSMCLWFLLVWRFLVCWWRVCVGCGIDWWSCCVSIVWFCCFVELIWWFWFCIFCWCCGNNWLFCCVIWYGVWLVCFFLWVFVCVFWFFWDFLV